MTHVLAAGVDSLYWSAKADSVPMFADLRSAREGAAVSGEEQPWASIERFTLSVLASAPRGYGVVLTCHEFSLQVTESRRRPTVLVQLRSSFIHEVGPREAVSRSRAVAEVVVGRTLSEPRPSRIDVYVDVADWVLVQDDRRGLVTHAKIHPVFRAGTDEVETFQIGKSPLMVRMYRKDIQVAGKGGQAPLFWNGWSGPVTRVEAQVSSKRLVDFHFASCDELLAATGDVLRYAITKFVSLREPGAGPRETWAPRSEWVLVREVGLAEFPRTGVVPYHVVGFDRTRVLQQLRGGLVSLAAIERVDDLAAVLERLPALLVPISRGREFGMDAARKRARLPRPWRGRERE